MIAKICKNISILFLIPIFLKMMFLLNQNILSFLIDALLMKLKTELLRFY